MAYTSRYTGSEIDTAIGAYLNGNTKTTVIVNVSDWKTSTGPSAKYYAEIALTGDYNVGNYPDIFIVDSNGVKVIPDVDYSARNGTFKVYSNAMVAGVIVINGAKTIMEKTT